MNGTSTTGQFDASRRSVPGPRGSAALSADGPATVVRSLGTVVPPSAGSSLGGIDSDLHRRLFPSDVPSGEPLPQPDVSGSQLEHFRIEEMIGRGGMGAVFRAYDDRLDRIVALKVLSPAFSRDPATVERFRNEARAAARLDHENVSRVFYSGEDRGMNFIAFEYVTGTNLRDLILENGRLSPEEAVNYTLQIAAALRHTSAAGVVHRDIKPSNIIITPSGRAKLVDLGLARKESTESSPDLTVAGTTLGTFDYISPEQAKDPRNVDVRSDIYSLGCTVYHMLTGEPPYPDGTILQKLLDRQDKSAPDPARKAPHVPASLSALVQKMMAGALRLRHASADELLNDLMLIAGELGLRGVHPEGLVWAHASRLHRSRFLERNLGWIVTAAILGIVVFAVDRFSRKDVEPPLGTGNGGDSAIRRAAADSSAGPFVGPQRKTPTEETNATAASRAKVKPSSSSEADPRPTRITLNQQLDPDARLSLTAGAGVLGYLGVATSSDDPDSKFAVARKAASQGDGGTGTKTAANGTSHTTVTGSAADKPAAISIVGRGEPFVNLEAACAAATDGQVIVLNFNGTRKDVNGDPIVDRPVRIANKSITIRAADGMHPVLLFSGEEVQGRSAQTKMVTVTNGRLNVFGVGLRMKVNDLVDADNDARWSLFALQGSDSVRLKYVNLTVDNPRGRTAAFFEIVPNSGPDLARMKMMKKTDMMAADRFEITVSGDSFLRGDADVLTVAYSRPGLLNVEKTAIVSGGSLLAVIADGAGETVAETDRLDVKLLHVTCATASAAIRVAVGEMPGTVLPVRIWSQDSLFAATGKRPFAVVSGAGQIRDLQRLLAWKGEKNFYRGFPTMWRLAPDSGAKPDSKSFDDWKTHWGSTEVDASETGVVWKRDWSSKSAASMLPADLELKDAVELTAGSAARGATDGTAVGADVAAIAKRMGLKPKADTTP